MTVKELGHLVLYVRNVERSAAFYRGCPRLGAGVSRLRRDAGGRCSRPGRTHHELLLIEVGEGAPPARRPHSRAVPLRLKVGDSDEELRQVSIG